MAVFVLFFFFKQKTAYEMRISDWSSDVCSSDLQARVEQRQRADERHLEHEDRRADIDRGMDEPDQQRRHRLSDQNLEGAERRDEQLLEGAELEIGRASCRERVCQYV